VTLRSVVDQHFRGPCCLDLQAEVKLEAARSSVSHLPFR